MQVSTEDYLRTIFALSEDKEKVRSIDIARSLGITKPSVNSMLNKLEKNGYIRKKPYSSIRLTKKGYTFSKKITHKHMVIEVFLKEVLRYRNDDLHEEAHRLEHAFSDKSIRKLDRFLKNPKISPTGQKIPH